MKLSFGTRCLIFILFAGCSQLFSAPQGTVERELLAVRVQEPPVLDGVLDEALWDSAQSTEVFRQKEPTEGQDSSEPTSVKVVYTEDALFIGIVCLDSSPAGIVPSELRRDGDLNKDDSVWILLDSFHDHRNAFLFATNTLGTQYDALVINEGEETNTGWDEVWTVASHRNEEGWSAEFEIPFEILRLGGSDNLVGIEFQRVIRRKNEIVFWNSWERDFRFEEVSRAGHLAGLENFELAHPWRMKGYLLGGAGERGDAGWENRSDVGIDDLKWRMTPTLTADMTLNTDFGQVEVDAQQANFSTPRDQLFFPEKREFFLEGAGFFDVSARTEENRFESTFQNFFSRRIGISAQENIITPIWGGAKLTGRLGGVSIGALNMQTQEEGLTAGNNYSVFRIRQDLFSRSSIGGIFTNRSGGGSFNRTSGLDTRVILLDNVTLEGFFLRSSTPGVSGEEDAYHGKGYWRSDLWDLGVGHLVLEPNFNAEMGFVTRSSTRKTIGDIAFKPRPPVSWLRQIQLRAFYEYYATPDNKVTQKVIHYPMLFQFESGDSIRVAPHYRADRLFQSIELAPGVVVPPGDYAGTSVSFRYTVDPSRQLAGDVTYFFQTNYFGGKRWFLRFIPQWKPTPSLIVDLTYNMDSIEVPIAERFYSHIVNLGVNYSLSTRLLTSTIVQYNNTREIKGINFRLNYIYRPGDDFFLVYRDTRNGLNPQFSDRAFLVKFTRSFDF